mgnify:CR=1 FL=1
MIGKITVENEQNRNIRAEYGKEILKEYMKTEYGLELSTNYNDSGTMLYDYANQTTTSLINNS